MNHRHPLLLLSLVIGAITTLVLVGLMGTPIAGADADTSPKLALWAAKTLLDVPIVRYVATTGVDSGDCSTSATPCRTIQYAVDRAGEGDEIRIASGVYTGVQARPVPNGYPLPPASGLITQVVYVTKTVTIRGGFTTTDWTTSDPEANHTTVDAQGRGRVFAVAGNVSPTIEGLRITAGSAEGLGGDSVEDCGGGIYVINARPVIAGNNVFSNSADRGGGLCLERSQATINGNHFSHNAAYQGGGILLISSAATVNDNTIASNVAYYHGGGVNLGHSNALLGNNTIVSNTALQDGGGVLLYRSSPTLNGNLITSNNAGSGGGLFLSYRSNAALMNNMVVDNHANYWGSGFYIRGSSPRLSHNTIAHNTGGDGSGLYVTIFTPYTETFFSHVILTNTILVDQAIGISVQAKNIVTLTATLWGAGDWANGKDWAGNGTVITGTLNWWREPYFVDPDGGDYHIGAASPARDTGVDSGVDFDIDGEPRPFGLAPDLGADEIIGIRYVDDSATGANDGTSWQDAFTHLQSALAVAGAGDEIWVAGGIYYPDEGAGQTNDAPTSAFALKPGVALYGGFAGTETLRSERNWAVNVTVLSGDIDQNDDSDVRGVVTATANIRGTNAYHVVVADGVSETARLDGFFITAGNASDFVATNHLGGGMFNDSASPTLVNVIFSGNAALAGGAIYNSANSNPRLTNVAFSDNLAHHGGGMYNSASNPTLTNVSFSGNSAVIYGGGMYNASSSPTLVNCILWGNSASNGPDIYNSGGSSVAVAHSIVRGGWPGAGNIDADPRFADAANGDLRLGPGSAAIDVGSDGACPADDLDGRPRPVGFGCDMGAYEMTAFSAVVAKLASDLTIRPGQVITFTVVITNTGPGLNDGTAWDTLPAGLHFVGPIALDPSGAGVVGSAPPALASALVISANQRVTITFPVSVSWGVTVGAAITNTVWFTAPQLSAAESGHVVLVAANAPPFFTSTPVTTASVGTPYTYTVTVSDSDLNRGDLLTITAPGLPAWLALTQTGEVTATLVGMPGGANVGVHVVVLRVTDSGGLFAEQQFTLMVFQPPAITSADRATFVAGELGTFTVTTTGFPTPTLAYSGTLPGGVTFIDNGDGTATLGGTPDAGAGGVYLLTLTASNSALPDAVQAFTLTVNARIYLPLVSRSVSSG